MSVSPLLNKLVICSFCSYFEALERYDSSRRVHLQLHSPAQQLSISLTYPQRFPTARFLRFMNATAVDLKIIYLRVFQHRPYGVVINTSPEIFEILAQHFLPGTIFSREDVYEILGPLL